MHTRKSLIMVAFALGVAACGSSSSPDSDIADMTFVEIPCVTASDCPAHFPLCLYAISDGCSAKGYCGIDQNTPTATLSMCGCNHQLVQTDNQAYEGGGGFAFAPVISAEPYPYCVPDGGTL